MTATQRLPTASWRELLRTALVTPGLVHEAYSRFRRYSLHNQLLAWAQCVERGISPGPLATFKQWQALGRNVIKGEKAIVLCVPVTIGARNDENDEEQAPSVPRLCFVYKARWFTLNQTAGREYEATSTSGWHEQRALSALDITMAPFEHHDGNTQGYALPGRRIAISPVAALGHKTLFHEVAHVLLNHPDDNETPRPLKEAMAEAVALLCVEALELPGSEYARGYLQHWLKGDGFDEPTSQRIITTAQTILAAGAQDDG